MVLIGGVTSHAAPAGCGPLRFDRHARSATSRSARRFPGGTCSTISRTGSSRSSSASRTTATCGRSAHARSRLAYEPATAQLRVTANGRVKADQVLHNVGRLLDVSYDARAHSQASASLAGAQATHRERSGHAAARRVVAVRVVRAHDPRSAGDRGSGRHADAPPGRALRHGDAGMRGRREFRQHRHARQARRDGPLVRTRSRRWPRGLRAAVDRGRGCAQSAAWIRALDARLSRRSASAAIRTRSPKPTSD